MGRWAGLSWADSEIPNNNGSNMQQYVAIYHPKIRGFVVTYGTMVSLGLHLNKTTNPAHSLADLRISIDH